MPGKKLLVADDSLTIQKVIRLALSNEGYEIQAVSDGNDAIQQIALNPPDVVLIDVSLPGKTAFEVKEEINAHEDLEEVRFVLMSSAFEKVDEALAMEVKFHGRLTKPFDPAHLRQVLTDVLEQITARRTEKTSLLQAPPKPSAPPPPTEPHHFEFTPPPPLPPSDENESDHEPTLSSFHYPQKPSSPPAPDRFPIERTGSFSFDPAPPSDDDDADSPENWEKSNIIQEELPHLSPSQREAIGELWEPEQDPTGPSYSVSPPKPPLPTPLPPELPQSHPSLPTGVSDEQDIKDLTESTMRINGMDDFQWSVKEPTLKPPPRMMDRGGSKFEIESPGDHLPDDMPPFYPDHAESTDYSKMQAPSPHMQSPLLPPSLPNSGPSSLPLSMPPMMTSPPEEDDLSSHFMPPPPLPTEPSYSGTSRVASTLSVQTQAPVTAPAVSVSAISQEQIESMVREQVEATLQKMIQKSLPDIAEKLIKQEIHRMLSES